MSLPKTFKDEWQKKAEGITFFGRPISELSSDDLTALVAYLADFGNLPYWKSNGNRFSSHMSEEAILDLIAKAFAPQMWVSVTDRLPNESVEVLVAWNTAHGGQQVDAALYFHNGMWAASSGHSIGRVTHWMPLPEPPESK